MSDHDPLFSPSSFDLRDALDDHFEHDPHDDHFDLYRRNESRAQRAVEQHVAGIQYARHVADLQRFAGAILGSDAFALGVVAGIARKVGTDLAGLVEIGRVFVLGDVFDRYCSGAVACLRDDHAWSRGFGSVQIDHWHSPLGMFDEAEAARRQRDAIVAELNAIMGDPVAFATLLPKRLQEEYGPKWRRFVELRGRGGFSSRFEAGVILGELVAEVVLLIAGVVAAGAGAVAAYEGAAKLASKLPLLVRFARRLPDKLAARATPLGESAAGGLVGETSALSESTVAPMPRGPAVAKTSAVEPTEPADRPARPIGSPASVPLTKADGRTMLREAVGNLKTLPPRQREAQFREYAKQITEATNGQWSAKQWPMTKNGSVYAGEGGEALVFDDAGNMYRGHLMDEQAFARTREGLLMDYSKLKSL